MKRPAESDLIIYAREAFRAAGFGLPFAVERLAGGTVRARSIDWHDQAFVRWLDDDPTPVEVEIREGLFSWASAAKSFTDATSLAVGARVQWIKRQEADETNGKA